MLVFVEDQRVQFRELFLALSRGDEYLLLDNGAYFSLDKPGLQALARLIEEARALQDRPADSLRISRFQAGLWAELAELGVVQPAGSAWQRQVGGLLASTGSGSERLPGPPPATAGGVPLPAGLTAQLRPYQSEGFQWLAFLWKHQLGGILADDMGLGKTLQALALIAHAREEEPAGAAVPHRRADQRRVELGGRGGQVHARPQGGRDHRHDGPAPQGPRGDHRRRGRGGDDVHAAADRLRQLRRASRGRG